MNRELGTASRPLDRSELLPSRLGALTSLLVKLFPTAASMTIFIRSQKEMEAVLLDLPGKDVSPAQMADALASSLQEHGLVTQAFFCELMRARQLKKNAILQVASSWDIEMACSEIATAESSGIGICKSPIGNPQKPRQLEFSLTTILISLLLTSSLLYSILNSQHYSQPTETSSIKPVFSRTSSGHTMPEVPEADASDHVAPSYSVHSKDLHPQSRGHSPPRVASSAKDLSATGRFEPHSQVDHSTSNEKKPTGASRPDKVPPLLNAPEIKHSVEVEKAEAGDRARVGINNVTGGSKSPDVGVVSIKVGDDSVIEIGNQYE